MRQRSVLITGGTTGIGHATAKLFAEKGYAVATGYLDRPSSLPGVLSLRADIRDPEQVNSMVDQAWDALGGLAVLVNCASRTGTAVLSPFLNSPPDYIDGMVDTNLKGTILVSQAVARKMVAAGKPGSIVHVASVGATKPQRDASIYCATKAAQVMLAKAMALELAPHGIRVNCVSPGDINTEASADVSLPEGTPLGRRGLPGEIAEAIFYLASPEAAFVTGANLLVDGGFLLA